MKLMGTMPIALIQRPQLLKVNVNRVEHPKVSVLLL